MCQLWGHSFHNARNPPIWPVSPIQNWTRVTRWTPKDPMAARITGSLFGTTVQWRYNEHDGVSNHRRLDCLINRLFRRRSKKISKIHVTGFCDGNVPITGEFPAQRASNAEHIDVGGECSSMKCEVNKIKKFRRKPSPPTLHSPF